MAEKERFELSNGFTRYTISSRAPFATDGNKNEPIITLVQRFKSDLSAWAYRSAVKLKCLCPSSFCTVTRSTPSMMAMVAQLCPYGIIGKNGEVLILQGVAPFAAAKSVPFQP